MRQMNVNLGVHRNCNVIVFAFGFCTVAVFCGNIFDEVSESICEDVSFPLLFHQIIQSVFIKLRLDNFAVKVPVHRLVVADCSFKCIAGSQARIGGSVISGYFTSRNDSGNIHNAGSSGCIHGVAISANTASSGIRVVEHSVVRANVAGLFAVARVASSHAGCASRVSVAILIIVFEVLAGGAGLGFASSFVSIDTVASRASALSFRDAVAVLDAKDEGGLANIALATSVAVEAMSERRVGAFHASILTHIVVLAEVFKIFTLVHGQQVGVPEVHKTSSISFLRSVRACLVEDDSFGVVNLSNEE